MVDVPEGTAEGQDEALAAVGEELNLLLEEKVFDYDSDVAQPAAEGKPVAAEAAPDLEAAEGDAVDLDSLFDYLGAHPEAAASAAGAPGTVLAADGSAATPLVFDAGDTIPADDGFTDAHLLGLDGGT